MLAPDEPLLATERSSRNFEDESSRPAADPEHQPSISLQFTDADEKARAAKHCDVLLIGAGGLAGRLVLDCSFAAERTAVADLVCVVPSSSSPSVEVGKLYRASTSDHNNNNNRSVYLLVTNFSLVIEADCARASANALFQALPSVDRAVLLTNRVVSQSDLEQHRSTSNNGDAALSLVRRLSTGAGCSSVVPKTGCRPLLGPPLQTGLLAAVMESRLAQGAHGELFCLLTGPQIELDGLEQLAHVVQLATVGESESAPPTDFRRLKQRLASQATNFIYL